MHHPIILGLMADVGRVVLATGPGVGGGGGVTVAGAD